MGDFPTMMRGRLAHTMCGAFVGTLVLVGCEFLSCFPHCSSESACLIPYMRTWFSSRFPKVPALTSWYYTHSFPIACGDALSSGLFPHLWHVQVLAHVAHTPGALFTAAIMESGMPVSSSLASTLADTAAVFAKTSCGALPARDCCTTAQMMLAPPTCCVK
jgi:hypothetical protein